MAHHFDTKLARQDPRLNICDFYVFGARPGCTTMVMTTNGDALISSFDTLHEEGIYAFRFDTDGDDREDVVFKFRFGNPHHLGGAGHRHVQPFTVVAGSREEGRALAGTELLRGETGQPSITGEVRAFVGLAPELWTADALGFRQAVKTLADENRFDADAFVGGRTYFERRNVMAIALEVPNTMISAGSSRVWSTISLFGHAPETQVGRFGFPLFTFLLLQQRQDLFDAYHAGRPAHDRSQFGEAVGALAAKLTTAAGNSTDAAEHAAAIIERFCPSMIPFDPSRPSTFSAENINGRPLLANAHNAMWTILARSKVDDGNNPDPSRWRPEFPYYGLPHDADEQHDPEKLDPESLCLITPWA